MCFIVVSCTSYFIFIFCSHVCRRTFDLGSMDSISITVSGQTMKKAIVSFLITLQLSLV